MLYTVNQTKDTYRSFELGNPECFEITQGLITGLNLSVNRLKLQTSTILEQFGGQGGVEALYDQSLYFDIEDVVTLPAINPDGTVNPNKSAATEKIVRVYKDCVITQEPNKKANDCYKLFGIDCPVTIPIQCG